MKEAGENKNKILLSTKTILERDSFFVGGEMKSKRWWLFGVCLAVAILFVCNIGFKQIYSLPDGFMATVEEIENANQSGMFGSFVSASMQRSDQTVSTDKPGEGTVIFKLFGIIPIRKVNVICSGEEEVYVGGTPIGISISSTGAIVINEKMVETEEGYKQTQKSEKLKEGDLLTAVNGVAISSLQQLSEVVEDSDSQNFDITYVRKNKECHATIKGEIDKNTGKYKLGLWVRDDVSGIGTLTYVNKQTNAFAALGHAITDNDNDVDVAGGSVYNCKLLGIDKGEKNNPGQLRCMFLQSDEVKGEIYKNTKYGVYGRIDNLEGLVDPNLTLKLGGRLSVKPGKAYIVSSVSGIKEEYEIEIIKASYQAKANDKSLVFRVKDRRLLELTGGIVQGMSGSPIVQNGKLIGAVTHVFMADPTKGYGVYSDWMVENEI